MISQSPDPVYYEPSSSAVSSEMLIASALHLMSHYTANVDVAGPCVKLASVIERHLKALADAQDLTPVLQATCMQLSEQWAAVVERSVPKPQRTGLFARLAKKSSLPA